MVLCIMQTVLLQGRRADSAGCPAPQHRYHSTESSSTTAHSSLLSRVPRDIRVESAPDLD